MNTKRITTIGCLLLVVCLVAPIAQGQDHVVQDFLYQMYGNDVPEIRDLTLTKDKSGRFIALWCEDGDTPQVFYSERRTSRWEDPLRLSKEGVSSYHPQLVTPCSSHQRRGTPPGGDENDDIPVWDLDEENDTDETSDSDPSMVRRRDPSPSGSRDEQADEDPDGPSFAAQRSSSRSRCQGDPVLMVFESEVANGRTKINFFIRPDADPWDDRVILVTGDSFYIDNEAPVRPTLHEEDGHVWLTWNLQADQALGYCFLVDDVWTGANYYYYSDPVQISYLLDEIAQEALLN